MLIKDLLCVRHWSKCFTWRYFAGGGQGQPSPLFLPEEFHGQGAGYSPWGHKELDTTEQLDTSE